MRKLRLTISPASSQLLVRAGIGTQLVWFQSWVISAMTPSLFLNSLEIASFKYIYPLFMDQLAMYIYLGYMAQL